MKARSFVSQFLVVLLVACKSESNSGSSRADYGAPAEQDSLKFASTTSEARRLSGSESLTTPEAAILKSLLGGNASLDNRSLLKFFEEVSARDPLLAANLLLSEIERVAQASSFREVLKVVFRSADSELLELLYPEILASTELSKSAKDGVFSLYLIRLSQLGSKDLKGYLQSSDFDFQGSVIELGELIKNLKIETPDDFKFVLEAESLKPRRLALLGVLGEICAQTGSSPRTVFELVKPGPEDAKYLLEAWMDTQGLRINNAAEFGRVVEAIGSLPSDEQDKFLSSWLPAYLDRMPYGEAASIIRLESLSVEIMAPTIRALSSSLTAKELVEVSLTVEDERKREVAVQSSFRAWVRLDNMAAATAAHNLTGRERDLAYVEIASQMRRSGDSTAAADFIDAIEDNDLRSRAENINRSLSR